VSESAKKKPLAPVVSDARLEPKEATFSILREPPGAVKPIREPAMAALD
jgi:hypothetical protein